MTLPVIRALGFHFDAVRVLANRKLLELAAAAAHDALDDPEAVPLFTQGAALPKRWRDLFHANDLVVSYLYDPAGIFEGNVRTCGVKHFIAGPWRIDPGGGHATEQLARPLALLGIKIKEWEPRIDMSFEERKIARQHLNSPSFAIHPGSGSSRKNWPIDKWIALIDLLLARGQRAVIVGGEADEKEIAHVRESFHDRVDYAINWPLRRLAASVAGTAFIGHDSGISHLAAAAGARCILLFGPTNPAVWAPRNTTIIRAPGAELRRLDLETVARECAKVVLCKQV